MKLSKRGIERAIKGLKKKVFGLFLTKGLILDLATNFLLDVIADEIDEAVQKEGLNPSQAQAVHDTLETLIGTLLERFIPDDGGEAEDGDGLAE